MEENKFEKQVRQKMDEFTVQPSEIVWDKIEARIEKKKRSRLAVILLFLLFCIVFSGGYWLWNSSQQRVVENKNSVKKNLNAIKNTDNKINKKENYTAQSKTDSGINLTNQNKNDIIDTGIQKSISKKPTTHNKLTAKSTINATINSPGSRVNSSEKNPVVLSEKKIVTINNAGKTENEIIASRLEEMQKNDSEYSKANDSTYKEIEQDTLSKSIFANNIAKLKDTSEQKKSITKAVKNSAKNKWKASISFSGGLSNIGNSVLDIHTSSSYSYDPALNSSSPGTGQGSIYYPSDSRRRFSFIIGFSEEKNITPKTKIALGLNFTSFRIKNKVGTLNSSTGLYNSQNAINDYNNYFNFIGLPVTLKVQIGKGKNIPLSWQAGVVLSELVSTNALQFSSVGYYYKDNSLFSKTQLGFNTGFFATLFSKQKIQLLIGPYLYYDAGKIAGSGLYNKKHFVFTGLQTQILFGK